MIINHLSCPIHLCVCAFCGDVDLVVRPYPVQPGSQFPDLYVSKEYQVGNKRRYSFSKKIKKSPNYFQGLSK